MRRDSHPRLSDRQSDTSTVTELTESVHELGLVALLADLADLATLRSILFAWPLIVGIIVIVLCTLADIASEQRLAHDNGSSSASVLGSLSCSIGRDPHVARRAQRT
mmetsp:Transcript_45232/g.118738  ORF Transcript_45232/g.118738 Transcript_45232/m.118738 type:complete len:107 (-) Transcript_45232:516-836(-)